MKLKNLLLIATLSLSQMTIAQTDIAQDEAEIKTTISKMIILIDENNPKDLIDHYADLPEDQKTKVIHLMDHERLTYMKKSLKKALGATPTHTGDTITFAFENSRPMVFIKKDNRWLLQN